MFDEESDYIREIITIKYDFDRLVIYSSDGLPNDLLGSDYFYFHFPCVEDSEQVDVTFKRWQLQEHGENPEGQGRRGAYQRWKFKKVTDGKITYTEYLKREREHENFVTEKFYGSYEFIIEFKNSCIYLCDNPHHLTSNLIIKQGNLTVQRRFDPNTIAKYVDENETTREISISEMFTIVLGYLGIDRDQVSLMMEESIVT